MEGYNNPSEEKAPGMDKRLGEGEAHDEANLLRAQLNISPETGKIEKSNWDRDEQLLSFESREVTAADYDNALAAIEEMKKIAEEEPTFERILNKLRDIPLKGQSSMIGVELALQSIFTLHIESFPRPRTEEFEEAFKQHQENVKAEREGEIVERLNSAENKLKTLRIKAEHYKNV